MPSSPSFAIVSVLSSAILLTLISHSFAVTYDNRAIIINGQRKIILSGSIHYPRSTPGMWPNLIQRSKEGGLNTIETYVFWNAHEPKYREYNFDGNLDLVRFMKNIQDQGLYAILRIGPYVCAEWTYGGFPVWLKSLPGISLRTNNTVYQNEMKTFTTLIVDMMNNNNLFATQGGPIILAQIENEYGNVEWAYGQGGEKYVDWCANLAQSYKVGIPWIMCQQDNAPSPMIGTCNGWYCDQWWPKNKNVPKMWTENWSGWYKNWGGRIPHRTAEDLAFAVARFIQLGGTMQNYYMYHGGTNFGETAGGPYIATSYDYDAPLDEYGNLNQPKWGHLKNLHEAIFSMEDSLLYGEKREQNLTNNAWATMFIYEGKRNCLISNTGFEDNIITFERNQFFLPGWSVSFVSDCEVEIFNTAKVNAQKSIMEYIPNHPDNNHEPYKLQWQYATEEVVEINRFGTVDKSAFIANNSLIDQKLASNGTSDYLWMMTTYVHNASDPKWVNKDVFLHVHTYGPGLHAFVNKELVGFQNAEYSRYNFQFERKIKLNDGPNQISLLSISGGYSNYGPHFDTWGNGVVGPVQLIARRGNEADLVKDISHNRWVYKTGLRGIDSGYQNVNNPYPGWSAFNPPVDKPFTWYKTNFISPGGTDPVVVDLLGMGKGAAWINGHHIGRYWPKYLASENGCDIVCNYKGNYSPGKCNTGCGQPTQRYYHIPRDWLRQENNQMVLFEEIGGNPKDTQIQTVTIGKICANAYEYNTLKLHCQGGHRIAKIKFASFGDPQGVCGAYTQGRCHSVDSLEVVKKACVHKKKCFINVNAGKFANLPPECRGVFQYRLAVEAVCYRP